MQCHQGELSYTAQSLRSQTCWKSSSKRLLFQSVLLAAHFMRMFHHSSPTPSHANFCSAIFILYSYDDPNDPDYKHIHDLSHPMSISAHTCLELTKIYLSGDLTSAQRASPFLLTWGFRCLKYFYDRYQVDGHRESLESLNVLRRGLEALGDKWKLAGMNS